ncbi:MAG TPA: hypothetical protein DEQ14_02700 [Treponema sp.]|nr:hypothetical protein [Treponema sp.]
MRIFFGIIVFVFLAVFQAGAQTPDGEAQPLTALQHYQQGRDLESRNRINESNEHYTAAINICQDEVARNAATRDTYAVITWALQRQQKYADVITWGERGLRLYADEYRIMETMGEAYFYLNDYDRSLSFMQRYTNAAPQGERSSVAYFFIGEIYRIRRRYRHADIAYTTAVRLEPRAALWWYRLATVREASGDTAQAIEAYQRALRLDPAHQGAAGGLARLQGE